MNNHIHTPALLSLMLLSSYVPIYSINSSPIVFESVTLKLIDGTPVFNGSTVTIVQRYRKQVHTFMNQPFSIDGQSHSLVEWAQMEAQGPLSLSVREYLPTLLNDFESFSEPFLDTIRSAKPVLVELIKEFCQKRNRQESFLLRLAFSPNGEERMLFKHELVSYNLLCNFCIDMMHFLKDLLHSCPKAYADYKHYNDIAKQVHFILTERNIVLKRDVYRALMTTISKQYEPHEEVTRSKVEALVTAYLKKHTT
jgi:hypothetical protein